MKTFAGIDMQYAQLENAKVVLIPVAYDGTSTWGKGADKGPEAFLEASQNMELYDIETNFEVYKQGIFLAPFLKGFNSPEEMVNEVYETTKKYLAKDKLISLIGGEHSISIGAMRAFGERFPNLTIVQLDAHTDLRPTYHKSPYNHACAMYEASKKHKLIQVGIRSMDVLEKEHIQKGHIFYAHEMHVDKNWPEKVLNFIKGPLYVTIDLDVFDPSILPSTGTPEPGGMQWYETLDFLKKVFVSKQVLGFDIVELAPNEKERSSDFLAAKLYYKLLSYKFEL